MTMTCRPILFLLRLPNTFAAANWSRRPCDHHELRSPCCRRKVLDGIEGCELHVVKFSIFLLHLPDVDVVNHVAGLPIDQHWSAWALPRHALHCGHERCRVRQTVGLV